MRVLVTGGTGFIGSNLCPELLERGHDVTALSRDPDAEVVPDAVSTAQGDVTDPESIVDAFEGQDVVVNLVALSPLFKPRGGNEKHHAVHTQGTKTVVDTAEACGLDRIVQMSALGADSEADTAYLRSKGDAETLVRESSLESVLVRPSVVFGEGGEFVSFTKLLTPPLLAPLPGGGKRTRFQPIWVEDLVSMLADCVDGDAHAAQTYEIGGPAVLTLADVAKQSRNAAGHPVKILPMPMALAGAGLKLMGNVPGFPMGADQYRSLTLDNTVSSNDVDAFDVDTAALRTLDQYLTID